MILSIIDDINKFIKPVRDFIFKNSSNPLFWFGVIAVMICIFGIAYAIIHERD